ncbi:MAG: glutamate cyclase domain-containing protein [Promethearchaeota archaeon]
MPSIKVSHNELIGTSYLAQLPEGGKRAYQIMFANPPLIQDLKTVAESFEDAIKSSKSITIATGFPVRDTFETDGPIGAFILGNFLLQQGLSVTIICEPELLDAMAEFPWYKSGSTKFSLTLTSIIRRMSEVFISIERPGQNLKGISHNMRGEDITSLIVNIEEQLMKYPPDYWLAIGDGGNELGLGALKGRIQEVIPFGKKCNCPCEGGIAVEKSASDYLLGMTSNLATLMFTLELANLFHVKWEYAWETEINLLRILNSYNIVDGVNGELNSVDGFKPSLTKEIIRNMQTLYKD